MGFWSSWLGGGGGEPDEGAEIIQEAAENAEENASTVSKLWKGKYDVASYKHQFSDVTKQKVHHFDSDVKSQRKEREKQQGIYRDKLVDRVHREVGIPDYEKELRSLEHKYVKADSAGQGEMAENLRRTIDAKRNKLGGLKRMAERRIAKHDFETLRENKRWEFGIKDSRQDVYDNADEQWRTGFKTAREQVERRDALRDLQQQQTQWSQRGTTRGGGYTPRRLGENKGFGPQPGGGSRPSFTNPGK